MQRVVSDGSLGLPATMAKHLPQAKQQQCLTHKVRRLQEYLCYAQLPTVDDQQHPLKPLEAKRQRRYQIQDYAYNIDKAENQDEARQRLADFIEKWQPIKPKAVKTFQRHLEMTFSYYQSSSILQCPPSRSYHRQRPESHKKRTQRVSSQSHR